MKRGAGTGAPTPSALRRMYEMASSPTVTITNASQAMSFDNPVEYNRAHMGFIGQHATRKS